MKEDRKYIVLIIYDIVENKHRVKMAKLLSSFGQRVQKSAFEAYLTQRQYDRMVQMIEKEIKEEDNIRIYRMNTYQEIKTFGTKDYTEFEDVIII